MRIEATPLLVVPVGHSHGVVGAFCNLRHTPIAFEEYCCDVGIVQTDDDVVDLLNKALMDKLLSAIDDVDAVFSN